MEDKFSMDQGVWGGGQGHDFQMIQLYYIYHALYYYHISSMSDQQTLDPRGWGPLP